MEFSHSKSIELNNETNKNLALRCIKDALIAPQIPAEI
ncbi:hypothetical protein ACIN5162_1307 [Acinetobacter baumannii OIFC0162]|nr:hypothetical protein ACINIS116_1255 [Acinetobacter baumannii IS-116]EKK07190.1 hypothetical protein ACIN5162_1307 [Acinetobacter baumannii OIFC0162]EKP37457.1 hypothetical protein ACIN5065_2527 [Acinetobacter baumannii OIFC065]EKU60189.1 hypothetical protein ACINWC348_1381 [Acinetobacter baumannii WC-348]ELW93692.1 hypothetical protein ACINAA014_1270 [Acinetobacter baumannii AA-014]ELW98564.1 hypothetical protein ACIN5047_1135 [Acinetobacter baumannii OIFC047]EXB83484.1 hypothetical protei